MISIVCCPLSTVMDTITSSFEGQLHSVYVRGKCCSKFIEWLTCASVSFSRHTARELHIQLCCVFNSCFPLGSFPPDWLLGCLKRRCMLMMLRNIPRVDQGQRLPSTICITAFRINFYAGREVPSNMSWKMWGRKWYSTVTFSMNACFPVLFARESAANFERKWKAKQLFF